MGDTGEVSISVDGRSGAGTADSADSTAPFRINQSGWLTGTVIGLEAAAIACLAYAWAFRSPDDPAYGLDNTMSALVRASSVVITSVTLAVLCLVAGRAYQRSTRRRARFLALAAPALATIGIGALFAIRRAPTLTIFETADVEQISVHSHHILTAAKVAWWCAGLALLVLAAVAMLASLKNLDLESFFSEPRRPLVVSAGLSVAILLAVTGTTVFGPADTPAFTGQTADSVVIPAAPESANTVRHRHDIGSSATSPIPAGAGFLRITGTSKEADSIEGFNGQTGERLWWFSADDLSVSRIWSTGIGDASVVVANVRQYPATTIAGSPFVGIDATSGRHLWTKQFDNIVDRDRTLYGRSNRVVLLQQQLPEPDGPTASATGTRWLAVAPHTGKVMWSRDFRYNCHTQGHITDDAVVLSTCDGDRDLIASVLDPLTGQTRAMIRYSTLGEQLPPGTTAEVQDARGNLALIDFETRRAHGGVTRSSVGLLDLTTGRVAQMFADLHNATFIDNESVLLPGFEETQVYELSIFRLSDRVLIPTGLYLTESPDPSSHGSDFPAAAVGDGWVVRASTDPDGLNDPLRRMDDSYGLHLVGTTGSTTELSQCPDEVPGSPQTVPGALLFQCDKQLIGMN